MSTAGADDEDTAALGADLKAMASDLNALLMGMAISSSTDEDPLGKMAITLNALDVHVRDAGHVSRRLESNRLSLLYVHAVAAIMVGPLFLSYGQRTGLNSPSWTFASEVPGATWALSTLIGGGGVVLLCATIARSLNWAMTGLSMIMTWYLITASLFFAASVNWASEGRAGNPPGTYAVVVYAHMTVIMMVHLRTMVKLAKSMDDHQGRRRRRWVRR